MAAVSVHVPIGIGDTSVAHRDGYLMQRFGQEGPEVPIVLRAAHVGTWIAFYGMIQVGEFERIAKEEHGRVVSYEVPVAFFGIELHGKASDVPFGVCRAAFAGYGRESNKDIGLFSDGRE